GSPRRRGHHGARGRGPRVAGGRDERQPRPPRRGGRQLACAGHGGGYASPCRGAGREAHRRRRGRGGGGGPLPGGAGRGRPGARRAGGAHLRAGAHPMSPSRATARAHPNIALVKYWGKRDAVRILPHQSSLSVTLAPLEVVTTVEFGAPADSVVLHGSEA